MEKNIIIGILYEYYGNLLTSKQSEAIEQYYFEDLSLTEIADILGVSKQNVSETIKRSEKALLEFEKRLKLYEKFSTTQSLIEKLDDELKSDLDVKIYEKYKKKLDDILKNLN